jgi:ketosteroid isomerase-like protein
MTMTATRTDETVDIRRLIEDWAEAVRGCGLDRIMAAYTPDILSFDAIGQLQFKGAEAYRKHWQACIEMCSGMIFEVHNLEIETGNGVAFGHYLVRCGGTGADGREQVGWMRVTVGFRRAGGRWLIAHEHFSVPFEMESGKALFHLEP